MYHEWVLNFVKCFFSICGDDHVVFVLLFVDVVDDVDGFLNVVPSLHPWNKSYLITMDDDLLDVVLNSAANILLIIFASVFIRNIGL